MRQTGMGKTAIYKAIATGDFPPFIKIGGRASALPQSWLDAFVEYRAGLSK
ncbi:MAG: AlpA family phage regulatory protein [Methylobacteriaceae bacterium]|nr:AlpA family phage regulatory protein [Methylobacteriaceae bacterium]